LTRALAPLTFAFLLCVLAACSRVPTEGANVPSSLSAADQDFIASRHGGM
jgi:hypothetical protein